jgi:hypothetical protein
MEMLATDKFAEVRRDPNGVKYTVFPTYRWVALGTYANKTGGMDTISTKAQKQALLAFLWDEYPDFDIVMEGVIDSTIRSTYIDLFLDYQGKVDREEVTPRVIVVANFLPPLDVCIKRVYERNGGKPVKEDQIESKWRTVAKNVQFFKDAGLITLRLDTSKIEREEMLPKFLTLVDKYREGKRCAR